MAVQSNLNFHQTFKPEVQYISSILSVADGTTAYEIRDISNLTGIPNGKSSGKVEPHILYSSYMGLIDFKKEDGKYTISLTPLGKVVLREDPGLQEELTILLCHAMMCRKKNGADVWSRCFLEVFPKYKDGIKKEILLKELDVIFPGKVNTKNMAPFFGSYEDMFSLIGMLSVKDDIVTANQSSYNKEFIYLYALVLWSLWDDEYSKQDEISSIQLDELSFGKVFGWNLEQEYKVLEALSDKGIVRLNRQLMPYTILRLTSNDVLMDRLYSELC